MSTNILGSANFGKISLGNGSSHAPDKAVFPVLDFSKPHWVSDFDIEPPRVKIDLAMKQIVDRICTALVNKTLKYKSRQRKDWTLKEIMQEAGKKESGAQAKLIRDGHSATIAEVSNMINRSSIDHTTKFLLSNEPLYVYALSFVIYYERVKDAEGMNDRVIVLTESEIKPFFNVLLAKAAIEQKHLDLSADQKSAVYKAAASTGISYLKGMPARAISKIISKYVDNGGIHDLVDKFFETGEIDPAKGTPQIRQLMVDYLNEIGLIVPEQEKDATRDNGEEEIGREDAFDGNSDHDA